MPATTRQELIEITAKEFTKLAKLVRNLDPEIATSKDTDDTSIKDVVAHRAHWIELFLGWQADGQAGKDVHFPAKGYKWNDLKRYNADLRTQQADLTWSDALSLLDQNHQTLLNFVEEQDEVMLYGGPMPGAKNNWTTGRWAEAAGPSHYRSAAKYIRARLRALT